MPSRERPHEAPDAAPSSVADAEEEAARAEALAEAARARALELRQQAEAASSDQQGVAEKNGDTTTTAADDTAAKPRLPRLRPPGLKAVAVSAAILLICVSLAASGFMLWQHHTIIQKRQRAAEFAAAAGQAVVRFMSIDANHAKDDLQRIIDASTGQFKAQLEATSTVFVKQAEDSKVVTKATVEAVGVESMTDDSAVVLVVAKSETTNPDKTKRPPASWRLSVNISRDGGQLKMSKVDFV